MTSVLVTGATGNQGGSVVDHLLASETEFDVSGLTRDASSERAQELADRGVTMVEGDLNDKESLAPHVAEVDAVFAVTNFWTEGYDGQVQQGKNLAEVASEEGVEQFVFSGVGSHERDTGVPHFDSAWEIDQYAQELDLPLTVLQPVFFFQNLEAFAEDVVEDGQLALPLEEGVSLQMIDTDDVGRAAAVALANPDEFVGERIELAGDEKTLAETAETLSEVTGENVEPVHVPIEDAYESFGEEFTVMCEWFNEVGYDADIGALEERFGFAFTDLESYLRENGWEDKDGMASVPGWVKAMQ
ncbi:NmrA family protein [Haloterrigena turkmenica DSM 5511]|uniref:NmrA family protein n=1 Tax=Haloterrigena turkmenica (strain ATCC 51198 / DSM 5511 / JCM 9101 / NCIMB 13204 / VKM B-1734 / 4k) TaxID=543526 RepID=D2RQP3_HALTV|nr:NmrA/HSCARG family protein [Haloterrigena turkmenica]ADB60374.1 NmrA family protein [Haloterrigena turkmenica DSM 5511]